jgi:hypothetical protein
MLLLRTHPARAAEMRYKLKLMTKRGADKPYPIPAIFNFSFFSQLISPNTTGRRQYVVTSCCYYYCCSSFFFFKIKICCYKNPQQASSKRKPTRPNTHTHTHTHREESWREKATTRVHSTQEEESLAGEMERS